MNKPHPARVSYHTDPLTWWVLSWAGLIDDLTAILTFGRFTSRYRGYLLAGKSESFTKWKNKRKKQHEKKTHWRAV